MFTRYDTFVILAETLQWDEAAIDFVPDKEAWPALDDTENARLLGLIAGFCIAESAVSGHLGSFQAAASDDWVAACFRAQARDEHRHARFFDRVAAEVAAVPGADVAARLDVLRTLVSPELVALFEDRLPATALRLAEDREGLTAAVGLYHMVLEGVVLLAGQNALLDTRVRHAPRSGSRARPRRSGGASGAGAGGRGGVGRPGLTRGSREVSADAPEPAASRRQEVLLIPGGVVRSP
jgi:ribonucleoside-diphosphate reductase beta chain